MDGGCFFFAGGGTGGHIYPAIALAEKIAELEPTAKIHFFCSTRNIDAKILSKTCFEVTYLPAKALSIRPGRLIEFAGSFLESYRIAKSLLTKSGNSTVIGIGGFVAAPVCYAAHKLNVPVKLLNVDVTPGWANKVIARWADEVFVQFEETEEYFAKRKTKVSVVGCPLRSGFKNPVSAKAIKQLGLDESKKILLVTGASSGSQNINEAICSLLGKLNTHTEYWQIVHLTGISNYEQVKQRYIDVEISHKVLGYYDDMPNLLAAADLVIGRGGAVSVAEYTASSVPSICIPYPYHKDRHQYLNAGKLVEAGAAVIVDDLPDNKETADWLWEELEPLLKDEIKRRQMAKACESIANKDAASKIAKKLMQTKE